MHRSEIERAGACAACGAEVGTAERIFTFGNDEMLCFRCAAERGGAYDERHDHWDVHPRVEDLLERSAREA